MTVVQKHHTPSEEVSADLNLIADQVEVPLARLNEVVSQHVSNSFSRPGRSKVGASSLFVYRTFHTTHMSETEPVVVGIAMEPRDHKVIVRGDVSGEESGTVYFELTQRWVENSQAAVLATAMEFASELSQQAEVIVAALTASESDQSRSC